MDVPAYVAPEHERAAELFDAVNDGDLEQLQKLLADGVPAGALDDDGNSALHKAAEGETDCAKALMAALAASTGIFEVKNGDEKTCLEIAISYEDGTLCRLFLDAGAKATAEAVALAREGGVPDVIKALTGEVVEEKAVQAPADGARRVSVSGGDNITDFTKQWGKEQAGRRQSCHEAESDLRPRVADDALHNAPDHAPDAAAAAN